MPMIIRVVFYNENLFPTIRVVFQYEDRRRNPRPINDEG